MPREQHYLTIEKECLAILWGIQRFHVFLYGVSVVIQTDHQPLRYLNTAKNLNAHILRWTLRLQEYNFRGQWSRKMKMPNLATIPEVQSIGRDQGEDPTLSKCFNDIGSTNQEKKKNKGGTWVYVSEGKILYRKSTT